MSRRTRPDRARPPAAAPAGVAPAPARRPRRALRLAIAAALAAAVVAAALVIAPPPESKDTPEAALRAFFLASATGDEAVLRRLTLPALGFEYLLQNKHVPAGKEGEFRRAVAVMKMKPLVPGARLRMPDGDFFEISRDTPAADRAWIVTEGSEYPTELRRVDGAWKVDARKIIAVRRAAAARGARP
jgi:hypothetical protein